MPQHEHTTTQETAPETAQAAVPEAPQSPFNPFLLTGLGLGFALGCVTGGFAGGVVLASFGGLGGYQFGEYVGKPGIQAFYWVANNLSSAASNLFEFATTAAQNPEAAVNQVFNAAANVTTRVVSGTVNTVGAIAMHGFADVNARITHQVEENFSLEEREAPSALAETCVTALVSSPIVAGLDIAEHVIGSYTPVAVRAPLANLIDKLSPTDLIVFKPEDNSLVVTGKLVTACLLGILSTCIKTPLFLVSGLFLRSFVCNADIMQLPLLTSNATEEPSPAFAQKALIFSADGKGAEKKCTGSAPLQAIIEQSTGAHSAEQPQSSYFYRKVLPTLSHLGNKFYDRFLSVPTSAPIRPH